MQFKYVATHVLNYGVRGNWLVYNDPNQSIWELMNPSRYRTVYFKIQRTTGDTTPFYIGGSQIFELNDIKNLNIEQVLKREFASDYFIALTDLNTQQTIHYAQYRSTSREQFQLFFDCADTFISPNPYLDPTNIVPRNTPINQLPDLALVSTRYKIDMSRLHDRALISVNGLLHQTIVSDETDSVIYIQDGGKSATISGLQNVGIIEFEKVGQLQKLSLSDLTLSTTDDQPYYGVVTISDIEPDLTNYQVLLSIGGYLLLPDPEIYSKGSNNTLQLDLTKIQIENKIVEASKFIDLSSLELETYLTDPEHADIAILQSDEVLTAFLELSQSFIVMIPFDNMEVTTIPFRQYSYERQIETSFLARELVLLSTGRIVEYYNDFESLQDRFVVRFLEFMQPIEMTTSTIFPVLKQAYPELVPPAFDLIDQFYSLGFTKN